MKTQGYLLLLCLGLWVSVAHGYRKLTQCDICAPNAASVCNAMSPAEQEAADKRLQDACVNLTPSLCCSLRGSSSWAEVSACRCAGLGSSTVSVRDVDTICGCGADAVAVAARSDAVALDIPITSLGK